MKREIKFRAWCNIQKSFVDPIYNNINLSDLFELPFYEMQQFTGLKDKNGTEIYEGDIIKRFTGYVFVQEKKFFSLGLKNGARCYGYDYHENDEVIGNIHQNSNLLK